MRVEYVVNEALAEDAENVFDDMSLSWQKIDGTSINFGFVSDPHWFRFKVKNLNHSDNRWVLYSMYTMVDYLDY